ncbi:hypothetical protein ACVBEF_10100 [Glaciimonas sp. GG7]
MKFDLKNLVVRTVRTLYLPLLILGGTSVAHAQLSVGSDAIKASKSAQQPIQVHLTVHKVHYVNGKEILSAAVEAEPGETLEYRAVYSNTGSVALSGVLATLPISPGAVYIAQSAKPTKVMAHTKDGDAFAAVPLQQQIVAADGSSKNVDVPYADYRGLQWDLGSLKAGEKKTVVARVSIGAVITAP